MTREEQDAYAAGSVRRSQHAIAAGMFRAEITPVEAGGRTVTEDETPGRCDDRLGWGIETLELYEINEAFAAVALAAIRELGLPHERVNVLGGACALGHPIGASGVRLLVTLLHALRARGQKRGVAALCIGGGEATALAIECL